VCRPRIFGRGTAPSRRSSAGGLTPKLPSTATVANGRMGGERTVGFSRANGQVAPGSICLGTVAGGDLGAAAVAQRFANVQALQNRP
jgi:hypothetical protein